MFVFIHHPLVHLILMFRHEYFLYSLQRVVCRAEGDLAWLLCNADKSILRHIKLTNKDKRGLFLTPIIKRFMVESILVMLVFASGTLRRVNICHAIGQYLNVAVVAYGCGQLARQKGYMGNTASTGEQIVEIRRLWE